MKRLALALAATLALPVSAAAYCASPAAGSIVQSCESGVRVMRNQPLALPRIDPAQTAQLELQRDRLALDRRRAADSYDLARRRIALEQQQLNQTDYLYRDANSPLRGRGFGAGYGSYGYGFGTSGFGRGGFGFAGRPVPKPPRPVRRRH